MLICTKMFERHLDWLSKRFSILSLDEIGRHLESDRGFHRPPAAITFDDGYGDVYHNGFPLLKRKGIPAAVFVVTDLVGTGKPQIFDRLCEPIVLLAAMFVVLMPFAALRAQETPTDSVSDGTTSTAATTRPQLAKRSSPVADQASGIAGPDQAMPAIGDGPVCPISVTIYDVRVPNAVIGLLDLDSLTKAAADPTAFDKALGQLGTALPLYRMDQTVRLAGDKVAIGAQSLDSGTAAARLKQLITVSNS